MLIGIFYSQIVESSSLVSVLFREDLSHPYISFFHLLVNGFSVIIRIINFKIISSISSDEIPPRSACKFGSFSPEVRAFGTLMTSTNVFRLIICKAI